MPPASPSPPPPPSAPRIAIIGAGSRGNAYARALNNLNTAHIVAIAEPVPFKRRAFVQKYIHTPHHHHQGPDGEGEGEGEQFDGWESFVAYETARRERSSKRDQDATDGEDGGRARGVDGVVICTLDEMHVGIVQALAPLGLHVLCEKPLATRLEDVLGVWGAMRGVWAEREGERERGKMVRPRTVFGICHVLRYSPHNLLLRDLVVRRGVVGDVLSVEHTEPVGWWHFAHSYVRGHWRKESTSAPSLLTKSCHDIDFLLWLLCSPAESGTAPPHLPAHVSSSGSLSYFKRNRKPVLAGDATNCLSCAAEPDCIYSAKKIYLDMHLKAGNTGWPVKIVTPEIEDIYSQHQESGQAEAEQRLLENLAEDYDSSTTTAEVDRRPWFGRCVYESANDVCDDQTVTIAWDDENGSSPGAELQRRGSKTATFHMVAATQAICERRGKIYGTKGEITYDSSTIQVYDFASGQTETFKPHRPGGGHGGGDEGLANQFVKAIDAVKNHGVSVEEAQNVHLGCSLEEIIRSHALVFAAEEARRTKTVIQWPDWWARKTEGTGK